LRLWNHFAAGLLCPHQNIVQVWVKISNPSDRTDCVLIHVTHWPNNLD